MKKKVCKIGDSLWVSIPSETVEELGITEGQKINVEFSVLDVEDEYKPYKCKICGYEYHSPEEDNYCPACGNEDKEKIQLLD